MSSIHTSTNRRTYLGAIDLLPPLEDGRFAVELGQAARPREVRRIVGLDRGYFGKFLSPSRQGIFRKIFGEIWVCPNPRITIWHSNNGMVECEIHYVEHYTEREPYEAPVALWSLPPFALLCVAEAGYAYSALATLARTTRRLPTN